MINDLIFTSGCCNSIFYRSETPFSEDLDMPPFVGTNNYYKTSRELESRSTEVAKYMNGDDDSDANSET